MKYVISFFYCCSVFANPIQLTYEGKKNDADVYKNILINEYKIPEDLISMKAIKDCDDLRGKGKFDLCLKNNGDLLLVSVDSEFISESLKVFRAP